MSPRGVVRTLEEYQQEERVGLIASQTKATSEALYNFTNQSINLVIFLCMYILNLSDNNLSFVDVQINK